MFANGSEYMMFIEENCCKCKKYMKNGEFNCKIEEHISIGDFTEIPFPKEVNVEKMTCSRFIDENKIVKRIKRPIKGQISLFK